MRRGAHTPIFDPGKRRGQVSHGATIGAAPTMSGSGSPTQTHQVANGSGTVTNPASLSDFSYNTNGAPAYEDPTLTVVSGDFLLCAVNYRAGGAASANAPVVDAAQVNLAGLTSIYASAAYDTLGIARGSARVDRATAAASGNMLSTNLNDHSQLIMRFAGISGAPVQTARSTLDATDSCNISLPSTPSGTVIVIIAHGGPGTISGANTQPAAPAGWTKLIDLNGGTSGGFVVLKANTPQQTLTYSLAAGATTGGGRDVAIMEW